MGQRALGLFAKVERAQYFRQLAPWLHVERLPNLEVDTSHRWSRGCVSARQTLALDRYFSLDSVLGAAQVAALASAVELLEADRVPALFVFAYDEAWQAIDDVSHAVSALVGQRYAPARDVWAWRVAVDKNARGWPPHRGSYDADEITGVPSIINTWLALSNVTVETACMHLLPASRDPNVDGDLHRSTHAPSDVLALPARPGTLLGWSANLLHWGGEMLSGATSARMSLSVTLTRVGDGERAAGVRPPTLRQRLDLIAEMISIYGHFEGASFDHARDWASVTRLTQSLARRR